MQKKKQKMKAGLGLGGFCFVLFCWGAVGVLVGFCLFDFAVRVLFCYFVFCFGFGLIFFLIKVYSKHSLKILKHCSEWHQLFGNTFLCPVFVFTSDSSLRQF